ncbi:hypothetical protein [Bacillus horti]|uniref:Uncharacterized protein n=1 Tax=Caldalkalibacillus horti TaxID=77523 RepID=A0ABT9VXP8_9BACI|nr:hypothetical protein [Bacillus horti]MDQ0165775.1 hypothetical protein [Bacillus horti]
MKWVIYISEGFLFLTLMPILIVFSITVVRSLCEYFADMTTFSK